MNSRDLACKALDEFLTSRLYSAERQEWVEKAFITRLWISLGDPVSGGNIDEIRHVLESLSANQQKSLSPAAGHAAQIVRPRGYRKSLGH